MQPGVGVLTKPSSEKDNFQAVSRSFKWSLAVTPQGVSPKAGLSLKSIVSLRLGGGKSAYLGNC